MVSRTDVHRPWRVQLADPVNRSTILYRYAEWPGEAMSWTSFRNIGCGCWLCTDHLGRKWARKQERVSWRKVRARLLRDPEADDYVPPGSAW